MNITLDCDGVLLNWEAGFRFWIGWTYNIRTSTENPAKWDLSNWLGCGPNQAKSYVAEFNKSASFGDLWPMDNAERAVRGFVARGHVLRVISACHNSPTVVNRRKENLIRIFGNVFSEISCVPLHTSKHDALAKITPGLWIEDNYANAIAGQSVGHRAIMVRHPHNKAAENPAANITWVDSLADVTP